MTDAKFETVVARQVPEPQKRARADFVVETSDTVENCNSQIDAILTKLESRQGDAYERFWRD
jgi:dephospho-CoA kinase